MRAHDLRTSGALVQSYREQRCSPCREGSRYSAEGTQPCAGYVPQACFVAGDPRRI